MSDLNVQLAREHVIKGRWWLRTAELPGGSAEQDAMEATMAAAHFSAAMAITNILLTDPAEAPEPVER